MARAPRTYSLTMLRWDYKGVAELFIKGNHTYVLWRWTKDWELPLWQGNRGYQQGRYLPSLSEMEKAAETTHNLVCLWQDLMMPETCQDILLGIVRTPMARSLMTKGTIKKIKDWFTLAPVSQRKWTVYKTWETIKEFHPSLEWRLYVGMIFLLKFSKPQDREMLLFPQPPKWLK